MDLRSVDEGLIQQEAVAPDRIDLCLLKRQDTGPSRLDSADSAAVMAAVNANSLFYDSKEIWKQNLSHLGMVVAASRHHRLTIGGDGTDVAALVDRLQEN